MNEIKVKDKQEKVFVELFCIYYDDLIVKINKSG